MFYVIQHGGEPVFYPEFSSAGDERRRLVLRDQDKQCGVFLLGSGSASLWWFGKNYTPWVGFEMSLSERLGLRQPSRD